MKRLILIMCCLSFACTTDTDPPEKIGPQGEVGSAGPQGEIGQMGARGFTGLTGKTGLNGPTGSQGIKGEPGALGEKGEQGLQGEKGLQGGMGLTGPTGPKGPEGPTGPQGDNAEQDVSGSRLIVLRTKLVGSDGSVHYAHTGQFWDTELDEPCEVHKAWLDHSMRCMPILEMRADGGNFFADWTCKTPAVWTACMEYLDKIPRFGRMRKHNSSVIVTGPLYNTYTITPISTAFLYQKISGSCGAWWPSGPLWEGRTFFGRGVDPHDPDLFVEMTEE